MLMKVEILLFSTELIVNQTELYRSENIIGTEGTTLFLNCIAV